MFIAINIYNNSDKPIIFSNAIVKLIGNAYPIDTSVMHYNYYMPYDDERAIGDIIDVQLDAKKLEPFHITGKNKISPKDVETINLEITGTRRCWNYIYNFEINLDFTDVFGKHDTLLSDKNYYIGFLQP